MSPVVLVRMPEAGRAENGEMSQWGDLELGLIRRRLSGPKVLLGALLDVQMLAERKAVKGGKDNGMIWNLALATFAGCLSGPAERKAEYNKE